MGWLKEKDAGNNTFYKSEDEKFIIIKIEKRWTVWIQTEKVEFKTFCLDGYRLEWEGLSSIKESKEFIKQFLLK